MFTQKEESSDASECRMISLSDSCSTRALKAMREAVTTMCQGHLCSEARFGWWDVQSASATDLGHKRRSLCFYKRCSCVQHSILSHVKPSTNPDQARVNSDAARGFRPRSTARRAVRPVLPLLQAGPSPLVARTASMPQGSIVYGTGDRESRSRRGPGPVAPPLAGQVIVELLLFL